MGAGVSRAHEPLIIVGAGGLAREVAQAVADLNEVRPTWDLHGFLDDDPSRHGSLIAGHRVLGPVDAIVDHPSARLVVPVANPSNWWSRARLVDRLRTGPAAVDAERFATIIHPGAVLAADTEVGPGTVVLAGVITTTAVQIGTHVALMPGTILTHDDRIGRFATIASGVRVGGAATIEKGVYVGAGVLVGEGVRLGAWCQVGLGSMVRHDVPAAQVWVGSPARFLRDVPLPRDINFDSELSTEE